MGTSPQSQQPGNPDQPIEPIERSIQKSLFPDVILPAATRRHQNGLSPARREELLDLVAAQDLNSGQRALVDHIYGPLLALAGAGSGKTHSIVYRTLRLIGAQVVPKRILLLTFTKKARAEMEGRCKRLLRPQGTKKGGLPTVKTLDALGKRILKEHGKLLKFKDEPEIVPEMFRDEFLEKGLKSLSRDITFRAKDDPKKVLAAQISRWKNHGISPSEAVAKGYDLAPAYVAYQRELAKTGFVDFEDLVRLPTILFNLKDGGEEILKYWQNQFDYIMIDEYQDTNPAQEQFVRLIAARHHNFCAIGDDDQSIYAFRDADVSLIRTFSERWIDSKVCKLELNYRSTPEIVAVANNLMANVKGNRHEKVLRAVKPSGITPTITIFPDDATEAEWIAHTIKNSKRPPGDFAILVRDQYRARAEGIIDALIAAKVDYSIFFTDDRKMSPTRIAAYSLLSAISNPLKAHPAFLKLFRSSAFRLSDADCDEVDKATMETEKALWSYLQEDNFPRVSSNGRATLRKLTDLVQRLHHRTLPVGNDLLGAIIRDPLNAHKEFLQLFQSKTFRLSASDYGKVDKATTGKVMWTYLQEDNFPNVSSEGQATLRKLTDLVKELHPRTRSEGEETLGAIALEGFKVLFPADTAADLWKLEDPPHRTATLLNIVERIDGPKKRRDESAQTDANGTPKPHAEDTKKPKVRFRTLKEYLNFELVEVPRAIKEGRAKKKASGERTTVSVMSIHGSKGLEFPVVFAPRAVEGVIPHERVLEEEQDRCTEPVESALVESRVEEERRLLYVAVTRAEEELHISYPSYLGSRSGYREQQPSRFLLDMGIEATVWAGKPTESVDEVDPHEGARPRNRRRPKKR
jgi:superfamily I DNA/RNA helicase